MIVPACAHVVGCHRSALEANILELDAKYGTSGQDIVALANRGYSASVARGSAHRAASSAAAAPSLSPLAPTTSVPAPMTMPTVASGVALADLASSTPLVSSSSGAPASEQAGLVMGTSSAAEANGHAASGGGGVASVILALQQAAASGPLPWAQQPSNPEKHEHTN